MFSDAQVTILPSSGYKNNKQQYIETIFHCWLACLNYESYMKRNIEVYICMEMPRA